jgi:hypothetical protein
MQGRAISRKEIVNLQNCSELSCSLREGQCIGRDRQGAGPFVFVAGLRITNVACLESVSLRRLHASGFQAHEESLARLATEAP